MRRPDTTSQLRRLIEKLRSAIPDVVLRTTMIVGFPGETDRQFDELLEFVKWAQFDALGCFRFYPESGTDAALLPDQVPENIKQQRLDELMLCQQEIAFTKNRNRIGNEITCLVDSVDDNGFSTGRFFGQAPDIDSVCMIEMKNSQKRNIPLRQGQFINAKVTGTRDYDLVVERI
jgi:ribosomal protein S12 methylthiotransferase